MTGNSSPPEGSRRKAHAKRTNEMARAKRERDALLSGREYSASGMSRVSPSPAPLPEKEAPPPYTPCSESEGTEAGSMLMRLTVLAVGGGVDRTLKFEAEGCQTLAELCVQAHPALVMTGQPICFKVSCNGTTWLSTTDGASSLSSLSITDGSLIKVEAQSSQDPQTPVHEQPETVNTPIMSDLPPSPIEQDPEPEPQPEPQPVIESPMRIETPLRDTPSSSKPILPRSKRDSISLKVIAKERRGGGPTRVYEWEVPPGEKLVTLCKRCNLTEPQVPARNNSYRGFVVTAEDGEVWCTKQHGRLSIRELRVESGDEITVEMDWASLGVKPAPKKVVRTVTREEPVPVPQRPNVIIESPEEPIPVPEQRRAVVREPHRVPGPRAGRKTNRAVSPTAEYHVKTGIPAPPLISTDRSQSPRRDPLSPSPVAVSPPPMMVPLPVPVMEASTLSPSRVPGLAPVVPAVLPPRQTKGVDEDIAWLSFVDALSAVLHEQDLLLVSAETVRDLIRHYGFDKDPISAAKIELHWKRLSGRAPPDDKMQQAVASPTQDPRHVRHIDTVFPEGRRPEHPAMSDEAARRVERGQRRRQRIVEQEEVRAAKPFTSLPFGGGMGETPMSGVIGRKLEQEPSIGRRRAVSPAAPIHAPSDKRMQNLQQQKMGTCNPNNICDGQVQDDAFAMYSRELRSIEYSENKHKQSLVAPGKKQQVRNKNPVSSEDYSIAGIGNGAAKTAAGKARGLVKEDSAAGCDPNPFKGDNETSKRGRNFKCGPDKAPANSNPNAAGNGEQWVEKGQAKAYSMGPERIAGGCNPNSAGAHGAMSGAQHRKGGISTTRMYEAVATCNPNDYNQEGDRRHAEAERVARAEGDKHFRVEQRGSAPCDPNHVGEREPQCKMTKKGAAEFSRVDAGKGCDPNSLTASGSSNVHLQGPAGSAGVFSPGLVQTGKKMTVAQPAATANPNHTLSEPATHLAPQPTQPMNEVPTASRKQGIRPAVQSPSDPNCVPATMSPSPRAGGRRRAPQHPASLNNNIRELLQ